MNSPTVQNPKIGMLALIVALLFGAIVIVTKLYTPPPSIPVEASTLPSVVNPFDTISLEADAAVVYDATTGRVLFDKHASAQLPLASLTKLIVAYTALNTLPKDTVITIEEDALRQDGDSGLLPGDSFALDPLTRFILTTSSNDASYAISEAVEKHQGNTNVFKDQLAALLLSQTYLINGTGLDESPVTAGAYGSPYDIAFLLSKFYTDFPDTLSATAETTITINTLHGRAVSGKNTDMIVEKVAGLLGGKTGYTALAGGNLAVILDIGINHPVAIVVMSSGADTRFSDVEKLISATRAYFTE